MLMAMEFLGRARVLAGGREVMLSRQCLSFLAYLALHRNIDHPREVLIEKFWADQDPARARSSLGSALCRLRKALTFDGMVGLELSPLGAPRLSSSIPIWADIWAFEAGLKPALAAPEGELQQAFANALAASLIHYKGDLLLGWYDDWILTERERLLMLCLRGHRRLMQHHVASGDFEAGLAAGLAVLRLEPLDEMVQQRVIELYALTGQRAAALRQYERLVALLKAELGVAPARETRALIDRIRDPYDRTGRLNYLNGSPPDRQPAASAIPTAATARPPRHGRDR
jgi:DNA-binding SARP family transcriptional activator